MYENRTIEYSNFYANELEYDLHGVIEREKIHLLVVELSLFEVWLHGWCTTSIWIKIIFFPAEERGVLMRQKHLYGTRTRTGFCTEINFIWLNFASNQDS